MKKQILLFIIFLLVLFSKNVLFHSFVLYDSMPGGFWQYFAAKFSVVLLICSLLFVTRTPWWTVVVLILTDIWAISNWMYYQSYGLFLSVSMISMANNLHGFSNSIFGLWDHRMFYFIIPTVLYSIALFFLPHRQKRRWLPFGISFGIGLLLVMLNNILIHTMRCKNGYDDGPLTLAKTLPFYINEKRMLQDFESEYSMMRDHSIIGYMPLHIVYDHKLNHYRNSSAESFTIQEEEWLKKIYVPSDSMPQPNSHLVLILVESLEAWPLYYEGITPRMNALRNSQHALFADKVSAQTRFGASGDGQLTFNTGLLPIQSGVTCILYGANTYPNIAHFYPRSVIINPSKGTWNQHVVTYTYGYKGLEEPLSTEVATWWNDCDVCTKAAKWFMRTDSLSCVEVITISSHIPFDWVQGDVACITPDTPDNMRRYLTCIHYADSCIGVLLDQIEASGKLGNTTIVISGDHNIFYGDSRKALLPYAQAHNLPIYENDRYLPLIIYSPYIKEKVTIKEPSYQMDIYPTVMYAIGCESCAWKGVGVNLFNNEQRMNRIINQEEAFLLSDKLIRNNWFKDRLSN